MIVTMLPRLLILLASCIVFSRSAGAQIDTFHARFDSALKQHGIVGGSFAFEHGSSPATRYFFGEARNGTGQRVDADTAYNWASITKTMTAIAILQLRDRGKLSLDDSAVRYVQELRAVHDTYGPVDDITIRHLLTHTSGVRDELVEAHIRHKFASGAITPDGRTEPESLALFPPYVMYWHFKSGLDAALGRPPGAELLLDRVGQFNSIIM